MKDKSPLKTIRLGFSLVLFALIILSFIGQPPILHLFTDGVLKVQFVPAFIQFISGNKGILILLLLITICFGRIYCSFICPLGVFQDFISRISLKAGIKNKNFSSHYWTYLQYAILFITLVSFIMGSLSMINQFDPYSIFGRITVHLFKPTLLFFNNSAVELLELFDIYSVSVKMNNKIAFQILTFTLIFFMGIILLTVFKARLYCNSICPVGLLLGIFSHLSIFRIKIDKERCRKCKRCENVCKIGCIDIDNFFVDQNRCVRCFNCLNICEEQSILYTPNRVEPENKNPVLMRRKFLLDSALSGSAVFTACSPFRFERPGPILEELPIMPPGSRSFDHFTKNCISCHYCISLCPTHVIKPSMTGYGISGLMMPELKFLKAHCDFDCNVCSQHCPTGAIVALPLRKKQRLQIGIASLNKKHCVVHVKEKHCGACGEACPTRAISPVEKGKVIFPIINIDYCIGCGACESACPTTPKAIVVTSNIEHKTALVYQSKTESKPGGYLQQLTNFPF